MKKYDIIGKTDSELKTVLTSLDNELDDSCEKTLNQKAEKIFLQAKKVHKDKKDL